MGSEICEVRPFLPSAGKRQAESLGSEAEFSGVGYRTAEVGGKQKRRPEGRRFWKSCGFVPG
jgi:hypothetical protein